MAEEIKEILDYLKRSDKNKFGFEQGKLIDYEEVQTLLDYITNLQQENEKLKFENGNLKTNEQINIEVHNKQLEIIKDYKSRCEKAMEYIKKLSNEPNVFGHYGIDGECKNWLLSILNKSKELKESEK